MRIRARVFMCVSAFACARGIDNPLDEPNQDGAPPVTVGTGVPSTVGPGAGGATEVATTSMSSAGGAGSQGRTASVAVGAGGSSAGSVGSGGVAGASGAGASGAGAGADAGGSNADSGADAAVPVRPTGIRLGAATPSGQQAPSANGTVFRQSCAADEVVIGYRGTIEALDAAMSQLRTFQAVCASVSVGGTFDFAVSTTSKETLPVVGTMPGVTQQTSMCPTDQVVVGFSGRSGADIDQIVLLCAPLLITGSSPNYALSIGSEMPRPPVGGPGGEPFAPIHCPAGQISMGNEGRAAFTINAFGLLCAPPALVVP